MIFASDLEDDVETQEALTPLERIREALIFFHDIQEKYGEGNRWFSNRRLPERDAVRVAEAIDLLSGARVWGSDEEGKRAGELQRRIAGYVFGRFDDTPVWLDYVRN